MNSVREAWFGGENPGTWSDDGDGAQPRALTLSSVWCATSIITSALASLPLKLYRKDGGSRRVVGYDEHPLPNLLHKPTSYLTTFGFLQLAALRCLLTGNFFARKQYSGGALTALVPFDAGTVRVVLDEKSGRKVFEVREGGKLETLSPMSVLHLKSPMLASDGMTGLSVLQHAKKTFYLAHSQERYGQKVFEQGTMIAGVLQHPGKLRDEARENLRKSWRARYAGLRGAGTVAVLEEGMVYNPLGMSMEDAQFVLSRQFSVLEIARFFNIPPHFLKDLTHATFANIEEQNQNFVDFCLGPWIACFETALHDQLLTPGERPEYYFKLDVRALLRGNSDARGKFYNAAISGGWMSVNECRGLEDRDPVEGGDQYFRAANLAPLVDSPAEAPRAALPAAPAPSRAAEWGFAAALVYSHESEEEFTGFLEQALRIAASEHGATLSEKKFSGYLKTAIKRLHRKSDLTSASLTVIINEETARFARYALPHVD